MAPAWQAYPSSTSTGINAVDRTYVDDVESIGTPGDAPATSIAAANSMFSLLKGICAGLDVPAGSGAGDTNDGAKLHGDLLETLGEMSDAPAADTGNHSAIAFLKGILVEAGI